MDPFPEASFPTLWDNEDPEDQPEIDLYPEQDTSGLSTETEDDPPPEPPREDELVNISTYTSHPTYVKEVKHVFCLPDYPETHEQGIAYLVDMRGMSLSEKESHHTMVQYCSAIKYPKNESKARILNNTPCWRTVLRCTGVKECEFLTPELRDIEHSKLEEIDWDRIRQIREIHSTPSLLREAIGFHAGVLERFAKQQACKDTQQPSCRPTFQTSRQITVSGAPYYYVSCCNWYPDSSHFTKLIQPALMPQIEQLKRMFSQAPGDVEIEHCTVLKQQSSRAPYCGVDHPQGQGKIISAQCTVEFITFRPKDLEETPYLIWISRGRHSHPPPPPTKTPEKYSEELIAVIRRINDPTLTTAGLLKHQEMRSLCERNQGTTLIDIHKSFANLDKVSALLRKERLLRYPYGTGIPAVCYEYELGHKGKQNQYIQDVFYDGEHLIVTYFYKEQVQFLVERTSFEIDMGFKRVRDPNINEIVLAAFISEVQKIFTFARIFVNRRNAKMYECAFIRLFNLISRCLEKEIKWQHLHNEGFAAVVTDMDLAQLEGFGTYLQSIDPDRHSWEWQAERTNIFCQIHFQRSIDKAAGTAGRSTTSIHSRMFDLVRVLSNEDYFDLCNELITSSDSSENVRNWAIHKQRPIIASGLNVHCSKIPESVWNEIRRYTNGVEATHWKSNSFGRRLSLLQAIQYSALLDKYDVQRLNARRNGGVPHTWRNSSIQSRFQEVARRDLSRRRPYQEDEDPDIQGDYLMPASRRRRMSRSSSRSSSRSQSSRGRTAASQRSLRQVASSNTYTQTQERVMSELAVERERAAIEREKLENELKREELRRKRLENDKLEQEIQ